MTTATARHARLGKVHRAWHAFRRWRRSRPFWGGLVTVLGGAEIWATANAKINLGGLTFQFGGSHFLSWLIPTILIACGLLTWFTPQQRMFYAIVASLTAVYSLIAVNFGGFLLGMLLGMIGSALAFAWTPLPQPAAAEPDAEPEEATAEDEADEESEEGLALITGSEQKPTHVERRSHDLLTDTLPQPRNPLLEEERDPRRDPPLTAMLLVLVMVSVASLVVVRATPAHAIPCPPASPSPTGTETPATTAQPSATSTETSTAAESGTAPEGGGRDGNVVTDFVGGVIDGIVSLFRGDTEDEAEATAASSANPAPSVDPTPTTNPTATADPTPSEKPTPTTNPTRRSEPTAKPSGCGPDDDATEQPSSGVKLLDAPPGHPRVTKTPSLLTGSRLTLSGMRMDGVVDLPTADGTIRVLKFSMREAVTDDFRLQVPTGENRKTIFTSDTLTVSGNVTFYATRFSARLKILNVDTPLVITLTPEKPLLPDGFPLPIPIKLAFSDPQIDLVFVSCDRLTAKPLDLRA